MKTVAVFVFLGAVALAAGQVRVQSAYRQGARQTIRQAPLHHAVAHQVSAHRQVAQQVHQHVAARPAGPVVARAAPAHGAEVVILSETPSNNVGLDGYKFAYQLSDGQSREESAQVETRGVEDAVIRVRGSFSFIADDGQTYTVNYIADENGFQPEGAHLPVAPQV